VNSTNGAGECGLCGRRVERLTRHHLVPRTRHKNKRNKKTFDRQEIHRTVGLCSPCHRHIHTVLDNKELERDYNTIDALKSHPDIQRFVAWIGKKPHGTTTADRPARGVDPLREPGQTTYFS
jgi:5-methylcytosine-specific restriction endonuclease McrA